MAANTQKGETLHEHTTSNQKSSDCSDAVTAIKPLSKTRCMQFKRGLCSEIKQLGWFTWIRWVQSETQRFLLWCFWRLTFILDRSTLTYLVISIRVSKILVWCRYRSTLKKHLVQMVPNNKEEILSEALSGSVVLTSLSED